MFLWCSKEIWQWSFEFVYIFNLLLSFVSRVRDLISYLIGREKCIKQRREIAKPMLDLYEIIKHKKYSNKNSNFLQNPFQSLRKWSSWYPNSRVCSKQIRELLKNGCLNQSFFFLSIFPAWTIQRVYWSKFLIQS